MNRVLVITDSEKVQKVFEDLEKDGSLQLKTVTNLVQSDAEVAQFAPDFVFVQSRISGLSGEIVLRHLRKMLPPDAKVAFLATGSEDAAGSKKAGIPAVELSDDDHAVSDGITRILSGRPPRVRKKSLTEPPSAARPRAPKQKVVEVEPPAEAQPELESPAEERTEAGTSLDEQREVEAREALPEAETAALPRGEIEVTEPSPGPVPGGAASFEEMMRRAAEKPAESAPTRPSASIETPQPHAAGKKRPIWLFVLIVAVVALLLCYLVIFHKQPPPSVAPKGATPAIPRQPQPQGAQQAPHAPALPPSPTAVPAAPPAPTATEGKQGASRQEPAAPLAKPGAARPAPPSAPSGAPGLPAAPAARPAPPAAAPANASRKAGLPGLPPFLAGVTMDPLYAKSHPGWQRYLGARAEYKLYREGDLYRAIQVIALGGQTIPDEIFRKVLREFGGIDSYRIESVEKRQHYRVEHCAGSPSVGLTIYRKISDARMKGFVLFYK